MTNSKSLISCNLTVFIIKHLFLSAEEERAMRRVSYLKATWGDRLHLDSDVEPDADHSLRGYLLPLS